MKNYQFKFNKYELAAAVGAIVLMVILATQVQPKLPLKVANPIEQLNLDEKTARIAIPMGAQLVEGMSAGKISLGHSADKIKKLLGKPNAGDAAMCKSWERWEWGDPRRMLEIYESCDAEQDMRKTVQQIRVSGLPFETKEGISPQSSFEEIQKYFPNLKPEATFRNAVTGQQMIVLDDVKKGIAFVVEATNNKPDPKGKCHTIIIHQPGKKAIDSYLQPQWKLHPL